MIASTGFSTRLRAFTAALRPAYDGPNTWLWFVSIARVGALIVVAAGVLLLNPHRGFGPLIGVIFASAFASSAWYLLTLRQSPSVPPVLTWTQMLVDFGVVAATISFTRGQGSYFTFLLVIVILEAGVLMGLVQGFLFASLATFFMFFQFFFAVNRPIDPLTHWYNYLIQGIAFFFTAFISGHWNQRINRMKQFQREILDNMNSGFLISDARGILIAVNKAACQILNLVEDNVAGRHVDGVMRPESGAECPITTALRLDRDFTSYEFHVDVDAGAGSPRLLGLTTSRIRDAYGRVTGLIASFTDLTEMAHMRRELRQQDRMAVIGELSAALAHEIRNPVAALRGAMDELGRGATRPGTADRLTAIGMREADHLNEIVTGFLDFARDPTRRREAVDVAALARETLNGLRHKWPGNKDLQLEIKGDDLPCFVLGDATQIRQVFDNLAQNAIEAMHGEGRLEISLHYGRGPVEIRFEDEGPGIPPDKVARIFEPFYTEKERGVGMGLAICLRMITAHDGTIQVASRPGGGTSMIVRLPAAPRE